MRGGLHIGHEMMRETDPRHLKVPAIVAGESLYGVERGGNPQKDLHFLDSLLASYEIAPFDAASKGLE